MSIGQGPTLSQAGLATGRLVRRLAWSRQAWLDTEGVFPYRASSSAAHAAGSHRLHTSTLACTVPGPFVQIAFADECLQWWLLFPVVVRTRGSPKLCTEAFSLAMWCVGRRIGHMPAWALPAFCVRGHAHGASLHSKMRSRHFVGTGGPDAPRVCRLLMVRAGFAAERL